MNYRVNCHPRNGGRPYVRRGVHVARCFPPFPPPTLYSPSTRGTIKIAQPYGNTARSDITERFRPMKFLQTKESLNNARTMKML